MVYMRQPGQWGVADWVSPALVGLGGGMGPGDPVPAVVELGPPPTHPRYRPYFPALARALGLRFWHVGCAGFTSYFRPFPVGVEEQVQVLVVLGGLGLLRDGVGVQDLRQAPPPGPVRVARPGWLDEEGGPHRLSSGAWVPSGVTLGALAASSAGAGAAGGSVGEGAGGANDPEDVFVCVVECERAPTSRLAPPPFLWQSPSLRTPPIPPSPCFPMR